jgi:hypothetical protein
MLGRWLGQGHHFESHERHQRGRRANFGFTNMPKTVEKHNLGIEFRA